jgi:hypothetical protein
MLSARMLSRISSEMRASFVVPMLKPSFRFRVSCHFCRALIWYISNTLAVYAPPLLVQFERNVRGRRHVCLATLPWLSAAVLVPIELLAALPLQLLVSHLLVMLARLPAFEQSRYSF